MPGLFKRLWLKAYRLVFGHDLFISYSRKDGIDYAYNLSTRLMKEGFDVYIDQLNSAEPGKLLPNSIKQKITTSTALVIAGSRGSEKSVPIDNEIELFLAHTKNRPVIPVIISDVNIADCIWGERIIGLPLLDDTAENLKNGTPSEEVVQRIISACTFTKKSARLRRISALTVALVILIIAGTVGYTSIKITAAELRVNVADSASAAAVNTARIADSIKTLAQQKTQQAESQAAIANQQKTEADSLTKIALNQKGVAEKDAYANSLIGLSNNTEEISNWFSAGDTAVKAYTLLKSKRAMQNAGYIFKQHPFIYGMHLHYLKGNYLLGCNKNFFYHVEDNKIIKYTVFSSGKFLAEEKLRLTGYHPAYKDSMFAITNNDDRLVISTVNLKQGKIEQMEMPIEKSSSYSDEELEKTRLLHKHLNFGDSILEISAYDGTEHMLAQVATNIGADAVADYNLLGFGNQYYALLELQQTEEDQADNSTRIKLIRFDHAFKVIDEATITVGLTLFRDYSFRELKGVIGYTGKRGSFFVMLIFSNGVTRYNITMPQERNAFEILKDFGIQRYQFISSNRIVLVKNGRYFLVHYLDDLDNHSSMFYDSHVVDMETDEYDFYALNDKYVMFTTGDGELYFYNLQFNPDGEDHIHSTYEDFIKLRSQYTKEFLEYIKQ